MAQGTYLFIINANSFLDQECVDICEFLFGCLVIEGPEGVEIEMNEEGRPSGSAFVKLLTRNDVENALKYNKQMLGPRYVDIEEIHSEENG